MKKSDIAMLILIGAISAFAAFMIANSLTFLKVDPKGASVPTFTKIESSVVEPDADVFNKKSINPTVKVYLETQKNNTKKDN